jgi:hypothetical protein
MDVTIMSIHFGARGTQALLAICSEIVPFDQLI